MSPITVYIEMPVYLKKYMISQSENKKEPVEFCSAHDYNLLLGRLLTNRHSEPEDTNQPGIKIRLPFNQIKDVYFYNKLSRESKELFREIIKNDLYFDFKVFVKEAILCGEERKIATEEFFLMHKITEDDLKYESFYRNFTRILKKKRAKCSLSILTQLNREIVHSRFYKQYRNNELSSV